MCHLNPLRLQAPNFRPPTFANLLAPIWVDSDAPSDCNGNCWVSEHLLITDQGSQCIAVTRIANVLRPRTNVSQLPLQVAIACICGSQHCNSKMYHPFDKPWQRWFQSLWSLQLHSAITAITKLWFISPTQ